MREGASGNSAANYLQKVEGRPFPFANLSIRVDRTLRLASSSFKLPLRAWQAYSSLTDTDSVRHLDVAVSESELLPP